MWLPKDERKLLRFYYHRINKVDGEESFDSRELVQSLICNNVRELRQREKERRDKDGAEQVRNYLYERNRVSAANKALRKRGLIELVEYSGEREVKRITLKLGGYDLGRKYSSWWDRSGLWFAEYRNHWVWIVGSFFGGIASTLFVQWLSRTFM